MKNIAYIKVQFITQLIGLQFLPVKIIGIFRMYTLLKRQKSSCTFIYRNFLYPLFYRQYPFTIWAYLPACVTGIYTTAAFRIPCRYTAAFALYNGYAIQRLCRTGVKTNCAIGNTKRFCADGVCFQLCICYDSPQPHHISKIPVCQQRIFPNLP